MTHSPVKNGNFQFVMPVGCLSEVLNRPLPEGSEQLLTKFAATASPNDVYISTPITTGLSYLRWLAKHENAAARERADAKQAVIRSNISAVAPLAAVVSSRFPSSKIINPTELADVGGWQQADYHRFWAEVITRHASKVVFAAGWHYSVGCVVEFAVGAICGKELYQHDFSTLGVQGALRMIQSSLREMTLAGASVAMHRSILSTFGG